MICGNYDINNENYGKILKHLQKISYHPEFTLVERNREMILDPLILLDLHYMKMWASK